MVTRAIDDLHLAVMNGHDIELSFLLQSLMETSRSLNAIVRYAEIRLQDTGTTITRDATKASAFAEILAWSMASMFMAYSVATRQPSHDLTPPTTTPTTDDDDNDRS